MPQPALLTVRYKLLLGGISERALVSPDLKKKGLGDTFGWHSPLLLFLLNFLTGMQTFGLGVQQLPCNHEPISKRIKAYIERMAEQTIEEAWCLMTSLKYHSSAEQPTPELLIV